MKTMKVTVIVMIFITISSIYNICSLSSSAKSYTSSSEEKCKRTMQLMLYPYVSNEVQNQYGDKVYIDIFDINVDTITINSPTDIKVVTIIKPYTGPHNTISTDYVTLRIGIDTVKVIDYMTPPLSA